MSTSASRQHREGSAPDFIERLDPGLDLLLASDARVEKVCEGFTWCEGPVWKDGFLFFSDVPANILYRWTPGSARAEVL
ncbi:MAG TPA: hypothetical protein VMS23_01885, partial [Terrimicrobiaceae bacterium]|nr:hypothetical protein [Terrimicrobiaceae bacterium]